MALIDLVVTFEGTSNVDFFGISAEFLPSSSIVLVTFSEDLLVNPDLLNPSSYSIVGPSVVTILSVFTVGSRAVAIEVSGTILGTYTLSVIGAILAVETKSLVRGLNPATFPAEIPYLARSLFTKKGPIAKPELVVLSGNQWSVQTIPTRFFGNVTTSEVVLPGASLNSSHVGLYLRLEAATDVVDLVNGGDYKILAIINPTRAKS